MRIEEVKAGQRVAGVFYGLQWRVHVNARRIEQPRGVKP